MTDPQPSPIPLVIAELAVAGLSGHVTQTLALLPGWAGGFLGGLVLLLVTRLVAPTLDVYGHAIKTRVTGPHKAQPKRESTPPVEPPDDTDASG